MKRVIEKELIDWKDQPNRKPLLVRGARQVGKSYVVEKFGKENFADIITVNFELSPKFIDCFHDLEPTKIIQAIELMTQKDIQLGHTLLFLDEIQQCPKAIQSLRYFKEKLPELHVIGAGSFLEFVINDDQYQEPVGRVQSLFMKPCSFYEYLMACGDDRLIDYLANVTLKSGVDRPIHELLLEKCREYCILGGMPEVIDYFIQQNKYLGCEVIHATILEYYRRDFSKYHKKINVGLLERIFAKAPALIAEQFRYVNIDPDVRARDQKPAIDMLFKAGILYPIYSSSASGLPFEATISEKKFKLLFLDIGLANHATELDISTLLNEDLILLNRGALSEQFVGQELLAYGESYKEGKLYFWARDQRGSQAEIDYLINVGPKIFPLEVKSGATGRLKSMQVFLAERGGEFGIQVSQKPLSFENNVLSVPLYMVHQLKRLMTEML